MNIEGFKKVNLKQVIQLIKDIKTNKELKDEKIAAVTGLSLASVRNMWAGAITDMSLSKAIFSLGIKGFVVLNNGKKTYYIPVAEKENKD